MLPEQCHSCRALGRAFPMYCFASALALGLLLALGTRCTCCAVDIQDIRAAWAARWQKVAALEYQYELVRPALGERPVPLHTTAILSISSDKIAYRTSSEEWVGNAVEKQTKAFVFDGSDSYTCFPGGPPALGEILVGRVSEGVAKFAEHLPIWLAHRPAEALERVGYNTKQMRLGQVRVDYGGTACLELSATHLANPQFTAILYVDPSREYLPVALKRQLGAVKKWNTIDYVPNDTLGWVVSGFTYDARGDNGEVIARMEAHVSRCSVNQTIPESTFTLTFPVGAHVARVQGDSTEFLLYMGDGKWQQLSEREFGVAPRPTASRESAPLLGRAGSLFAFIGVSMALLLAALMLARFRAARRSSRGHS